MKTPRLTRCLWAGALVLAVVAVGCEPDAQEKPDPKTPPKEPAKTAEAKRTLLGPNVWLEKQGEQRRVIIGATVCLREGPLEQLLTIKGKKEHEAPLAVDTDARIIHAALLAAGARPGTTVRFQPKYEPATGQSIKVTLQYEEKGKLKTVPAQTWVRNSKTRKDLDVDWVFAGSRQLENPLDPKAPPLYLANDGDVICVSNFESALLDLPINSPKENSELNFEAATNRIPEKETKVNLILEPIPEKKK
jgi:hypothetical protein